MIPHTCMPRPPGEIAALKAWRECEACRRGYPDNGNQRRHASTLRLLPIPRLTLTVNRQAQEADYIGRMSALRKKGLTKERLDDMIAAYRDGFSSALEMLTALGFLQIGD